jgi:hypothetical protein
VLPRSPSGCHSEGICVRFAPDVPVITPAGNCVAILIDLKNPTRKCNFRVHLRVSADVGRFEHKSATDKRFLHHAAAYFCKVPRNSDGVDSVQTRRRCIPFTQSLHPVYTMKKRSWRNMKNKTTFRSNLRLIECN